MDAVRYSLLLLVVTAILMLPDQNCQAQSDFEDQIKMLADAMVSQTGLHVRQGAPDILGFIKIQGSNPECEVIDVHWVSLPGKELIPAEEADRIRSSQSFSLGARRTVLPSCDPKSYQAFPSEFPNSRFIVFGTTAKNEIRGLHVGTDPRVRIVECPELFGEKSKPETKCGPFVEPQTMVSVTMPHDPELVRLIFFAKVITGQNQWHLERLGTLDLAPMNH